MMRFEFFKLEIEARTRFRSAPLASGTTGNSETQRFKESENEISGDANDQEQIQHNTLENTHTNVWASLQHGSSTQTVAEDNT